jgi:hypothetical protein
MPTLTSWALLDGAVRAGAMQPGTCDGVLTCGAGEAAGECSDAQHVVERVGGCRRFFGTAWNGAWQRY